MEALNTGFQMSGKTKEATEVCSVGECLLP